MRWMVTSLLIVGWVSTSAIAFQARGGEVAGAASIKACSILTRDLVVPFAQNPKLLDLIPPQEEVLGNSGVACEYGIVRLQLFPSRPGTVSTPPKDYQVLPGVGDVAYFRNNRNSYAELMVRKGAHRIDLQVSVPTGSTAEAIKPQTITLANAILAKLK